VLDNIAALNDVQGFDVGYLERCIRQVLLAASIPVSQYYTAVTPGVGALKRGIPYLLVLLAACVASLCVRIKRPSGDR